MPSFLKDILHVAVLTFGSTALGFIGMVAHRALGLLESKTHNAQLAGILDRVAALAAQVVKEVFAAYVQPLQAAGQWNDATAAVARSKALEALKAYLGPKGLGDLAQALGASDLVSKFLTTALEAAMHDAPGVVIPAPLPAPIAPRIP